MARAAVAFVVFCLASSGLYLINDVVDADSDRLHPVKCGRPIAAGLVSSRLALITAVVLIVIAEVVGVWLGYRFVVILTVFVATVVAYSYWLKHYPVVDLVLVAFGFVLRAVAGSAATGVQDSGWFLLLVSLGALFIVAGKRYADLHAAPAPEARNGVSYYNGPFLLYLSFGLAAACVAAYVLWVFLSPASSLGALIPLSIVPFAVAVGRYAYLIAGKKGGAPEDLFIKDKILKLAMLIWLVTYGGGIYVFS